MAEQMQEFVHYIEVRRENRSVIRHCRATKDCPKRHICFLKRIHMERHLKEAHDIQIDIPMRRMGRPVGSSKPPISESSRSIRQSKTRFSNLNFRVDNARKRKMKYMLMKAYSKWEASDEKDVIPFEEWRERYIKEKSEKWENKMEARKRRMASTIARGYSSSKRRSVEIKTKTRDDTFIEEMVETPVSNILIKSDSPLAPCKALKSKSYETSSSVRVAQPRTCNQVKITWCEPIDISSPGDSSKANDINILVSTYKFEYQRHPSTSMHSYMDSLKEGMVFHLRSTRFNIVADIDENLMNAFINTEASTKMLNLFALWMEFTMPVGTMDNVWFVDGLGFPFMFDMPNERSIAHYFGEIDLSTCLFTFFPIVESSHWTLAVFYNGHMCRLPDLPRGRSAILFFDSLGVPTYRNYLPRVHMVLQHFAKYTSHDILKMELTNASLMCDIYAIESPQQPNGYDCGFYTMAYMYFLVMGGLLHKRSRKWLTTAWFSHKDVECLKQEIFKWVQDCLSKSSSAQSKCLF